MLGTLMHSIHGLVCLLACAGCRFENDGIVTVNLRIFGLLLLMAALCRVLCKADFQAREQCTISRAGMLWEDCGASWASFCSDVVVSITERPTAVFCPIRLQQAIQIVMHFTLAYCILSSLHLPLATSACIVVEVKHVGKRKTVVRLSEQ
jgi:hypothetical protein